VLINLAVGSITNAKPNSEILALTAYLQRLGTDIKKAGPVATNVTASVASAILADVEPGILPGGKTSAQAEAKQTPSAPDTSIANPGGKMPPSTAGKMPATTTTAALTQ
jgi:hypothetical protein